MFTRPGLHFAPLVHQALGAAREDAVRFQPLEGYDARGVDYTLDAMRKILAASAVVS